MLLHFLWLLEVMFYYCFKFGKQGLQNLVVEKFSSEIYWIIQDTETLWKVKSKGYHNEARRNEGCDMLATKAQLVDPSANRDSIAKINKQFAKYFS